MSVQIGTLLAVACARATNLAFLYKHRGARAAADVNWRRPVRSAANLFRSRLVRAWHAGHRGRVAAACRRLAPAPLSLVQAVISGGLVFLAVLAERVFGLKVGPRQWLGIGTHRARARVADRHAALHRGR
jgi:hypothetical protein